MLSLCTSSRSPIICFLFLAIVNVRYVIVRPSVVCLSVCLYVVCRLSLRWFVELS